MVHFSGIGKQKQKMAARSEHQGKHLEARSKVTCAQCAYEMVGFGCLVGYCSIVHFFLIYVDVILS